MLQRSLSRKGGVPNGLGRAYTLWSACACHRPRELLPRRLAAAAAVDTPHGVQQEDEESPERNEFKTSFRELVVAGCRQMAARADCGRTFARSQDHFDALLVGTETGVLIDKTSKTMTAVQDRGQFHVARRRI